jgi:predicted HicB family RNase H-like nuclease
MLPTKSPHPRPQPPVKRPHKLVQVRLPDDVHRQLKVAAANLGVTLESIVIGILTDRTEAQANPHE